MVHKVSEGDTGKVQIYRAQTMSYSSPQADTTHTKRVQFNYTRSRPNATLPQETSKRDLFVADNSYLAKKFMRLRIGIFGTKRAINVVCLPLTIPTCRSDLTDEMLVTCLHIISVMEM